jgi:hypothetical protein
VDALFSLLPGDAARLYCGKSCTPVILDQIRHRLELDIPVVDQYARFVSGIFFGRTFSPTSPQPIECAAPCLGYSWDKHAEVLTLIARAAPVTFWLAIGFATWMIVGITFGTSPRSNAGAGGSDGHGHRLVGYRCPRSSSGRPHLLRILTGTSYPCHRGSSPFVNPVSSCRR